jgi:hypothetical protein
VERQRLITISYDGLEEEGAFRADLLVEDRVIVEIKSVERRARAHAKQLLTYLRPFEPAGRAAAQLRLRDDEGRDRAGREQLNTAELSPASC